ncbi:MAG TPA: PAS domain S-box protein [Thermodesulfovibrionales bacterium]|nr:PAS domain S-box protein [Thermodesulfovibrionales bacterium]
MQTGHSQEKKEEKTPASQGRLLVVDDEIDSLTVICEILSELGYEAAGFTSAREALETLKKRSFDLLLTDLVMPGMDGVKLLREAREIDPYLLCVMITGGGTIQTAVDAMKAGAFDYILKPMEIGLLSSTVSRAMNVCRLQRENAQLREFQKDLVESATDVIYRLSPDGVITALNPAFEAMTGWPRAEWIGKSFVQILHPGDLPVALEMFRKALRGEVPAPFELRVRAQSGEYLVGEFITPPQFSDGRVVGILGIARNITERKAADEQLRMLMDQLNAEKEFSDAILNNTPSGIMVVDGEGRILTVNFPGAEILAMAPAGMRGQALTDVYPETREMLIIDTRIGRETTITLRDGTTRPIGFSNSLIPGKEGNKRGTVIVFRDLTEIKELQAEVKKKQHFEALGKIISGVAHEIRNPLFAIQSIAQILGREIESPQHQALMQAILKETSRMRHLVDELLLYSRPSKLNLIEIDLDILLTELRHYIQTKKYKVSLSAGPIPPLTRVRADKEKLMQVLLNLVDNASGAESTSITTVVTRRDNRVSISFKDNGTGIKKEDMERIFDPFFTTRKQGTGLGLPICRKIIEDHGGTIEILSEEGEGTTVTLSLEAAGSESPPEA